MAINEIYILGCSINKSLSVLGLVISSLADRSMGKKNVVIPYRDSSLTRILQNALGGNSKTLMICAISPAVDNYEESMSTLRYADQAKKIKCHAVINESEQDKMIRELKAENEKLKELVSQLQSSKLTGMGSKSQDEKLVDEGAMEKIKELTELLSANSRLVEESEVSHDEKLHQQEEETVEFV